MQLAREIQDIAQRSRTKKLKPEDVQGGTFTITNYGLNGSLFGTPVILPPQVAILGVGTVVKRPVVINDAIAIRSMVYLSLSFDHRVMDGANADKFLHKIKDILESWRLLFMSRKGLLLQLDTVEYGEAWKLQKTLLDARVSGKIEDCLVLLQHPPTFTYGRRYKEANLIFNRNYTRVMVLPFIRQTMWFGYIPQFWSGSWLSHCKNAYLYQRLLSISKDA